MANRVQLYHEDNCYYLVQDISGLTLYQKTKVQEKFIKQETKVLEECVENALRQVFADNGINIQDTSESALNSAFDTLKTKYHKTINIVDLFANKIMYRCTQVGTSPNKMSVWLENGYLLQCGIEIEIIDLGEKVCMN